MTNNKEILSEKEVAEITGMSLGWVRRMRWLGNGIPFVKYQRAVRYHRSDVERFIEQRKQTISSCNVNGMGAKND